MNRSIIITLTAAALLSLSACSQPSSVPETQPQTQEETPPRPSAIIEEILNSREEEETTLPTEEELYTLEDGLEIQKVQDLITGQYLWQSVVEAGDTKYDKYGGEYRDYDVEPRYFETVDGSRKLEVRRWDNLKYSCGDYLIYEYDGTLHVAKPDELYQPVLSFEDVADLSPSGDLIMVPDRKNHKISFYDHQFTLVNELDNLRTAGESNYDRFSDGMLPVEDPQTGKFGYLDQTGSIALPVQYDAASDFSNGYASVLVGADQDLYSEDNGSVIMHMARGGAWGIIDKSGNFVLEPSDRTGNVADNEEEENLYGGAKGFSEVREDGTVDFINRMDGTVLFTETVE